MKKVMSIVMAGIMAAMMLVVTTGCNSKKDEYDRIVKTFYSSMDNGMCKGYIQYVRLGAYGSDAYRYCVMQHDYYASNSKNLVTSIDCEMEHGKLVWFFYVAELAG